MAKLSVITVKVPEELRRRMKEVDVNWSEYIRSAIIKKIAENEVRRASAKLDEIRARVKPVSTGNWSPGSEKIGADRQCPGMWWTRARS